MSEITFDKAPINIQEDILFDLQKNVDLIHRKTKKYEYFIEQNELISLVNTCENINSDSFFELYELSSNSIDKQNGDLICSKNTSDFRWYIFLHLCFLSRIITKEKELENLLNSTQYFIHSYKNNSLIYVEELDLENYISLTNF